MNIEETSEEAAFRREVRGWLKANIPARLRDARDFDLRLEVDRRLAARGYLGYTWPREFGGSGGDAIRASILDEEAGDFGVPLSRSPSRMGINLLGPTLITHGSEEQRHRFLPRIIAVEEIWCQGFSEPDAGSDLANVQSIAVDAGEHMRLSGSKLWTTQAQFADWCFVLARTDLAGPRHRNLSFLLVPMRSTGILVRPLEQLSGEAEFNQVFFDDVEVSKENVVGGLGNGWAVAMTTLAAERTYGLRSRYRFYLSQLFRAARLVSGQRRGALRDAWTAELGHLYADLTGIRNLSHKIVSMAAGGDEVAPMAPIAHLWWTQTHQRLAELGFRIATALGEDEAYWLRLWLDSRAETIYGGSAQVQRNLISERALGLPR